MNLKHRVALRIKTLRKRAGLSQEQLSEQIGRSVDAISAIERGKSLPSFETLERLSMALAAPVREFFDTEDEKNDPERTRLIAEIGAQLRNFDDRKLRLAAEMISSIEKS